MGGKEACQRVGGLRRRSRRGWGRKGSLRTERTAASGAHLWLLQLLSCVHGANNRRHQQHRHRTRQDVGTAGRQDADKDREQGRDREQERDRESAEQSMMMSRR